MGYPDDNDNKPAPLGEAVISLLALAAGVAAAAHAVAWVWGLIAGAL